ncbi:60S acidic ribosomal protein P0 [Lactuca sativa]|uniref:Large ribosomal subunit protein uL10-like insertion domain-containing protein n=1 Tax=Lactuca sativa TaxID=4236 RepID=A0A9R1V9V2_LACSA|nr:60S acidic ribosomal protein P0 [Lactuca sativa]KAJ0201057.1 hypothetical protein LSAT_V11C600326480 [Lactuca sativa]
MEASKFVTEKKKGERRLTGGYIKLLSTRMYFKKTGSKASQILILLFVGSVGLIFTKRDLKEVSEEVAKYKVGAPMHVGLVAPMDTVLNIPNKINKGIVEITTHIELIKKGDNVGSFEAVLLDKLGIMLFSYGLIVVTVYDNGSVFRHEVLDLTEEDLIEKFALCVLEC